MTAPESIDSRRRIAQCRNDMLSEACLNHRYSKPPMSFLRGQVGERESMGGGTKKQNPTGRPQQL